MICELCGLAVSERGALFYRRGALVHMEWHEYPDRRLNVLQDRLDGLSTNL